MELYVLAVIEEQAQAMKNWVGHDDEMVYWWADGLDRSIALFWSL